MAFVLSAEREREMSEILTRYPTRRAACIPILHLCQDQEGYVSEEAMSYVAEKLDISTAHVKGVVTFYTLFNTAAGRASTRSGSARRCRARCAARRTSSDTARSGSACTSARRRKDGKVTLRTAECLASCGTAPMMQVDKKYYENLTIAEVDEILDRLLERNSRRERPSTLKPMLKPVKILTKLYDVPEGWTLAAYERAGGYQARARSALGMPRERSSTR